MEQLAEENTVDLPRGARTVAAALAEAGLGNAATSIRVLDADARTAVLAAEALGIEVGAIANSVVFQAVHADGSVTPLLVLTSGAHRAEPDILAKLIGVTKVVRADPNFVRQHTGQPIGGVAPIGHPRPIFTVVDSALASYGLVWAAAGHPKTVFPITFTELVALTGGKTATVAKEEKDQR